MFELTYIIFGCIIGSFLTVCIYRIPFASLAEESESGEQGEELKSEDDFNFPVPKAPFSNVSINNPRRSFCPICHKQLNWYHNIPVLSWLFLRGKCAHCSAKIPIRYPLIELTTGIFSYLSFSTFGLTPTGIVIFIFACALIVITVIDYDYYIIPNVISIPGTIIALLLVGINQFYPFLNFPIVAGLWDSLFGLLSGAGFLLLVSEFYLRVRKIEGLGMGDVKLLAMTGALLGMQGSLFTIFIGSMVGAVCGLTLIVILRRKMTHPLPFGPYLAFATLLYIYGGEKVALIIINGISKIFSLNING